MHTIIHPPAQEEKQRPMLGDHLLQNPMAIITNGVTINAPLENVWPWIVQIGSGRAGWYSYDWIDNGGHTSAKSILPEHQQLTAGDIVPAIPGWTDAFCVVVADTGHLILTVPDGNGGIQVSYEFLLVPLDSDHTRLIVRGRISQSWPAATPSSAVSSRPPIFIQRIYSVLARIPRPVMLGVGFLGHHLMESKMLRGIKRRAEASSNVRQVRTV